MSGRIPRSFIDDLLARADVVELIDSFVPLKKAGRNYQACCPFHNEKTPSFTVAPDKQFYHCFGCGAHGNALSFLMEHEGLEFPEAVEELAKFYNMEVPREKGSGHSRFTNENKKQQQDDYELMENAARFFSHQLIHHPKREKVVEYLKQRGLSGDIVKSFNIGFAPPEWDGLLSKFGTDNNSRQQLVALKLVNQNDNKKQYDFFRDRVMFPIRDKRGRVIGFGGRIIDGDGPKYLNSPETRIFHKGSELYGLYQAKQANRKLAQVLIVEGYMDVVALAQFGIDYAVAALGTATTPEHVQLLFRNTQEIICCYDGDRAGRDAAWRAAENALPHLKDGHQIKFLFLPDGEDPDTMVRQVGKDGFEKLLQEAKPLSQFFFESLVSQHNVGTTEGKAALKAQALPMIEKIIGEHQKGFFMEQLSSFTGEQDKLIAQRDIQKANEHVGTKKMDYKTPHKVKMSPVRMMVKLLLEQPTLAQDCAEISGDAIAQIKEPGIPLLAELHKMSAEMSKPTTSQLMERFRGQEQYQQLSKLLMQESHVKEDMRILVYRQNFAMLLDRHFKNRMDELLLKSKVTPLSAEEKQELLVLTRSGS